MRCEAFYERWKKDPNWCEKSPTSVREIDHYLETHALLVDMGCDAGAVYKMFPAGVALEVLKINSSAIKDRVLRNAAGMIKRGDKVSKGDIKTWAGIETPKNSEDNPREERGKPRSDIPEISVKIATLYDEWPIDYVMKYPETLACRESGCLLLDYVRPGLHICGISKIRPENMGGKYPQGCPRARITTCEEPSIPARVVVAPSPKQAERFTVEASRSDMAALRQMIARHLAEDEQEAAQTCFEEGLAMIMDRIEAKVQEEAEAAE